MEPDYYKGPAVRLVGVVFAPHCPSINGLSCPVDAALIHAGLTRGRCMVFQRERTVFLILTLFALAL